ncbi:MAG: hypothetical protein H6719_04475 [Sandaracinaceae bacterium]|nr:hypothetical protein [Sandaracinaceae bacterium]
MRWLVSLGIAIVLVGCYRRHEGEGGGPTARDDASRRDGGSVEPPRRDGGSTPPARRDGGSDGETPLPPESFEDPGPDARPSDDPEAAGWGDRPDLDPDEPCCEPVGAPVDIPFADAPWGIPAIEWNGDGWGVLYPREASAFQQLDRDGARVGPVRDLAQRAATGEDLGFEWAAGRFFAVLPGELPGENLVGLLDRRGVRAVDWVDRGTIYGVAFVYHHYRWIALRRSRGRRGLGAVEVVELDPRLDEVAAVTAVEGDDLRMRPTPVGVVGLKSRAVGFVGEGATLRTYVIEVPVARPLQELEPVTLESAPGTLTARATRLRDRAVLVQGPQDGVRGAVVEVDAFTGTLARHPWPASLPSAWGQEEINGAAGLDVHDLVAACANYTDAAGGTGPGVLLRLLGPDGEVVGAPVIVEEGAYGCSVGTDGARVFVAWPRRGSGAVRVQAYRVRGG